MNWFDYLKVDHHNVIWDLQRKEIAKKYPNDMKLYQNA